MKASFSQSEEVFSKSHITITNVCSLQEATVEIQNKTVIELNDSRVFALKIVSYMYQIIVKSLDPFRLHISKAVSVQRNHSLGTQTPYPPYHIHVTHIIPRAKSRITTFTGLHISKAVSGEK